VLWIKIGIDFGRLDPVPDQGGQIMKKIEKVNKFHIMKCRKFSSPAAWTSFMKA
jgi:hypothetical protein